MTTKTLGELMSVYTVHEPPLRAGEASADPERFAFVRDGFYFWAFVLTPLWMLWRRMWIVFIIAVALVAVLDAAAVLVGGSAAIVFAINALISLLAAIEAGTLWRWTLARRGWKNVGLVNGDDLESAERRFFDAWSGETPDTTPAARFDPPAAAMSGVPTPRMPHSPDVIGLFPQPGAQR
jgi:hypothetical protein